MKKITAIVLLVLGLAEILFGFGMALYIYSAEAALAAKLGINSLSDEQQRIYHDHMLQVQNLWHFVAGFGVLNVVAAVILGRTERRQEINAA